MPAYNETLYSSPAPVVSAKLRNPDSGVTCEGVLLLIDSGADVTLLPKPVVENLGIRGSGTYELMAFDGNTSFADVVRAELLFLNKTFRGQFLIVDQDVGSSVGMS
jgi:predicted aspartyl protease